MDPIATQKRSLRAQLRRDRELAFMEASWLHIMQTPEIQSAEIVASYFSYGYEPQTLDINDALIRAGKTVILPRTLKDNSLEWVAWSGGQSSLRKKGKVLEPQGKVFSQLKSIDIVIVPALAIDREGNRMGQGGGSYDRALAQIPGWKVGLVGGEEIRGEPLPTEDHDQPLDAAATPALLLRFTRGAPGHL